MASNCINCGQPLLENDASCWQCGQPVDEANASVADSPLVKDKWEETSSSSNISALAIYGGLTILLLLSALAVTIYLGRQPLVQAANQRAAAGWAHVTNLRRDFTFLAPVEWELYDFDDSDAVDDAFAQLLASRPELTAATRPLSAAADDLLILFVAIGQGAIGEGVSPEFVVVAQSRALNDLTSDEAIIAARRIAEETGVATVSAADYVEDFAKSHLSLDVEIPLETYELHCQQQFVTGVSVSLIVAGCGPNEVVLEEILSSFQRLSQ